MKILVIGGGAREHALAWKLSRERSVTAVFCAPGNPGIASVARCLDADVGDPVGLLDVARNQEVDLTVVGPELPLSRGIVDVFVADGRAIVGPSQAAAALESSKAFAKDFMARHHVPTAQYHVCESASSALSWLEGDRFGYPLVLKADGLAAGKGVVIVDDRGAAAAAVRSLMVERKFGSAGDRIVFEEFLVGQEASYFVLADGTSFIGLGSAQDHKRIFDDDRGPNTGGMGAFAPSPLLDAALEARVMREIVDPVLAGMAAEGHPFRGFLYVGLMLTSAGPKVIEFNVRLGDPEAQVVLPLIDEPLVPILIAAAGGALGHTSVRRGHDALVGVVLASRGYPESSESGRPIQGVDRAEALADVAVYHAGTALRGDSLVTAGGRVLTVVGRGSTLAEAIARAYAGVEQISFDGMQYRHDIGKRALSRRA